MDPAQLANYEKAFARLSRNDLLAPASTLIELARTREPDSETDPTDLSEFYGTVHFSQDGLEYQRLIRSNWD